MARRNKWGEIVHYKDEYFNSNHLTYWQYDHEMEARERKLRQRKQQEEAQLEEQRRRERELAAIEMREASERQERRKREEFEASPMGQLDQLLNPVLAIGRRALSE